jgi:hypothetical protein
MMCVAGQVRDGSIICEFVGRGERSEKLAIADCGDDVRAGGFDRDNDLYRDDRRLS